MSADKKPRKHRHKRHYTFMIISGDSDGSTKRLHLNHFKTQVLAYCSFAIVLALVCYIIYSAMTIQTLRSIQSEQKIQIEELKAENSTLEASNETLITEEQQLRAALNVRLENEQQSAEEAETLAIPTGFPLDGGASAPMPAVDDPTSTTVTKLTDDNADTATGNPIVLFEAAAGSNIIATGSGTVLSVTTDTKFGNMVTIDHGNGYITFYRNAGTPLVHEGDSIEKGQLLFVVSDNTTLGYQIQQDDKFIDPEELIEING